MSTAKFRNQITNFKASVYRTERLNSLIKPGDQLILDFIKDVDFEILYQSKEFREMLDKRLEIKRLNGLIQ